MKLHPHPDPSHVMRVYRAYFVGTKRLNGTARSLVHFKDLLAIYREAKKEYFRAERGETVSYREENGQVVLTMSQDDYGTLLMAVGALMAYTAQGKLPLFTMDSINAFMNRLNQGNPNYTPYEVKADVKS